MTTATRTRLVIHPYTFRSTTQEALDKEFPLDRSCWNTEPEEPVVGLRCCHCGTESLVCAGKKDGKPNYVCLLCHHFTVNPLPVKVGA